MKVRLNVTDDAAILKDAKDYSIKHGVNLSQLVEVYFRQLTKVRKKPSLLDVLNDMPTSQSTFPPDFDFKKEYYEQKAKDEQAATKLAR